MTIDIPVRKTDDMSTVYTTNTPLFDAPIYDDMDGVIDESKGHYKSGISIEDLVLEELAREQRVKQNALRALQQELKDLFRSAKYKAESQTPLDEK